MDIWQYIIPAICAIVVTVIEVIGSRERKKVRTEMERAAKRAVRRAEESTLSMILMDANCKLALVTSKAVTNQKINGDLEEAIEAAKKAQKEYKEFILREASRKAEKGC